MDSSKQLTNVALFPLCDVHSNLIEILCDPSDKTGTRADALLLAWRFALPEGIDMDKAADAVLSVAMSIPRKAWSERQWFIVQELMELAGQKGPVPRIERVDNNGLQAKRPRRRARDQRPAGRAPLVDDNLPTDRNLPPRSALNTNDQISDGANSPTVREWLVGSATRSGDATSTDADSHLSRDGLSEVELSSKSIDLSEPKTRSKTRSKETKKWWKRVGKDTST